MGINVDTYKYDYGKLVDDLSKIDGVLPDKLREILLECGEVLGDKYVIINNEHYEGSNPYYSLADLIDSAFGVKDSFDVILKNKTGMKSWVDVADIAERLSINE